MTNVDDLQWLFIFRCDRRIDPHRDVNEWEPMYNKCTRNIIKKFYIWEKIHQAQLKLDLAQLISSMIYTNTHTNTEHASTLLLPFYSLFCLLINIQVSENQGSCYTLLQLGYQKSLVEFSSFHWVHKHHFSTLPQNC